MIPLDELKKDIHEVQKEYHTLLEAGCGFDKHSKNGDEYFIKLGEMQQKIIHLTKIQNDIMMSDAQEALEEAFTPRLQSMLSAKLSEELEMKPEFRHEIEYFLRGDEYDGFFSGASVTERTNTNLA